MVLLTGFLRFGEGTLEPMAWKPQNNEIPMENEDPGAEMMKFQRKMKVLASCCWARKRVSPGRNNRLVGLENNGNVRFGGLGPFPRPSRPLPPPGLCFRILPAWSQFPKMSPCNLLARPTGPNPTVIQHRHASFMMPVHLYMTLLSPESHASNV